MSKLLTAGVIALLTTASALGWEPGDETKCPAAGEYNNMYGFSIHIPLGLRGCPNSPVGMSDHGVSFGLAPPSHGAIDVYGGYNGPLYQDASESAESTFSYLKGREEEVKLRSRVETHLGRLHAIRQVIEFRRGGVIMIEDDTEALTGGSNGIDFDYAVTLTTRSADYPTDLKVLKAVLASWKAESPDA
jgi:hypothetical protein